jgi:AraC family transcriptional activator of tynA and feaB
MDSLRKHSKPFAALSTDSIPVADRIDFWQQLFTSCDIARPADSPIHAFHGAISRYARNDGSAFARISGGPLICRFGRKESGIMLLGAVRQGTLHVRHDRDSTTVVDCDSGFILLDCDRDLASSSTDYDLVQLVLPRSFVMRALGRRGAWPFGGLTAMRRGGLAPLLRAQLDIMTIHGGGLDETDASAATQSAVLLALAFMARASDSVEVRHEKFDDAHFIAARRYIEIHASRHDLTVHKIASAVGCSRAHLYRIFAERGYGIAHLLREVRLTRAKALLEAEGRQSISMIAFDSGYTDLSTFGKAFKRRFDMSPSECRFESHPRHPAER